MMNAEKIPSDILLLASLNLIFGSIGCLFGGILLVLLLLGVLTFNIWLIISVPLLVIPCIPYFLFLVAGFDILRLNPRSRRWIFFALPPWVISVIALYGLLQWDKEFPIVRPFLYFPALYSSFLLLYFTHPHAKKIFRPREDSKSLIIPIIAGILPLIALLGFDFYRGQSAEPQRSLLFYRSGVHEYETSQGRWVTIEYRDRKKNGYYREYELGHFEIEKEILQIRRGINSRQKRLVFEELYRDGKREGPSRRYVASSGQVSEEGFYRNDKKEGVWRNYDAFGALIHQMAYQDGLKDGEEILYQGEKQIRCFNQMDKPVGTCKEYDKDGTFRRDLPGFRFGQ